jgi:AcrR family transcriptional regulator
MISLDAMGHKTLGGGEDIGGMRFGVAMDDPSADPPVLLYDPFVPLLSRTGQASRVAPESRRNQRFRRSHILATIRQLLTEHGFQSVTVRRISEESGYAVQTIYNLVGPRNLAIIEAIGEYTRYVGRTAAPRPDDPRAVMHIINRWLLSIEVQPEFCRQVSLIFFTDHRAIYYTFRDSQLKGMCGLLANQQRCGVLKPDVSIKDLADQLVLLSSALCLEWSDRPFQLDQLHRRMRSGYVSLLADKLAPPHAELILQDAAVAAA